MALELARDTSAEELEPPEPVPAAEPPTPEPLRALSSWYTQPTGSSGARRVAGRAPLESREPVELEGESAEAEAPVLLLQLLRRSRYSSRFASFSALVIICRMRDSVVVLIGIW